MGNYNNKLSLSLYRISKDGLEEGLVQMINEIDSDFQPMAEEIVADIVENNDTVIGAIEDALHMRTNIDLGDISPWLINNETYCQQYDYVVTTTTDDSDDYIVALALVT